MQKRRINPTLIGVFVLGSLAIGILSVVLFGSQRWFGGDRMSFVCFFEDDVDGMQIGSKVKLKGVPIGEVKQILIRFKPSDGDESLATPLIPIIIEVNVERLSNDLGVDLDFRDDELYRLQIRDGLRASLGMGNLITGILQVNLDYHDDAKEIQSLDPFTYRGRVYRVIPTLPSQLAKATNDLLGVVNNISTADFKGVIDGLNTMLVKLNAKLDQFEVKGMNEAVESFKERMDSPKFDEMLVAFERAATSIKEGTDAVKDVAVNLNEQLGDDQIADVIESAGETFNGIADAAESVTALVDRGENVPAELEVSLQEISKAAAELKELLAYLKDNPSSVLWGRPDDDSEDSEPIRERQPWHKRPRGR